MINDIQRHFRKLAYSPRAEIQKCMLFQNKDLKQLLELG